MSPKTLKFLSYYRPYLREFILVLLCSGIAAGISLLFPLAIRYITKDVVEGGLSDALPRIYRTGAIMLGLAAVEVVTKTFYDYRGHAIGARMERDMRNDLFAHFQRLSHRFYDGQRTGNLMSRITYDLLMLAELFHHGPEDLATYIVRFIGAFVILVGIDVRLTLAVFAFLPVMAVFAVYFTRRQREATRINFQRIGDINVQVEDTFSGIRTVKSFANEALETAKFRVANERFLASRKGIYWSESVTYQGVELFIRLIMITVAVYGGARLVGTTLDVADLITYLLYVGYISEPIQRLSFIIGQYQEGLAGFDRFLEILETKPDIEDAPGAVDLPDVKGNVRFENVGFTYGAAYDHVLQNVSLDVQPGEYVALVGPSGVGKTTLCSLIPRFYDVSEGRILLDGVDIRHVRLQSLRRNIGVVQQDVYMFAGTVRENIRYGKPDTSDEEIVAAAIKADAHAFIMRLPQGYDTDIGQRGVTLSMGQKQRLSIARVFLKDPPVLIFDEATSALDYESEKVIQDALETIARGRTTFVIAHRLSTIRNAGRIIVLSDRGIAEQGTHEELLRLNGAYAGLYNIQ
ncbi:MAG: ABC transporter ATP-binding protein [Anaerolineae bacterium]